MHNTFDTLLWFSVAEYLHIVIVSMDLILSFWVFVEASDGQFGIFVPAVLG